jgi:hypothetical protein
MRRYFCGLKLIDLYFFLHFDDSGVESTKTHTPDYPRRDLLLPNYWILSRTMERARRPHVCLPACLPAPHPRASVTMARSRARTEALIGAARLAGSSHSGRVIAIIAAHEERPVATRYRPDPCGPSISYRACCGGALSYLSDSRHRRIIHSRLHLHHRPAAGLASLSSAARVR